MLLTWDPADHDNVTTLHVPKETVWCPDLVIFNTLTDINALNEQPTKVAIRNDGQVCEGLVGGRGKGVGLAGWRMEANREMSGNGSELGR